MSHESNSSVSLLAVHYCDFVKLWVSFWDFLLPFQTVCSTNWLVLICRRRFSILWNNFITRGSFQFYLKMTWEVSSWSELAELLDWRTEYSPWRQESFWDWSSVISWFLESLFRDVPGTVAEHFRTCGFRRKSSSLNCLPKIRDSVLLISCNSFVVTLSKHVCEACGQVIPPTKDIPGPSNKDWSFENTETYLWKPIKPIIYSFKLLPHQFYIKDTY